MNTSFRCPGQDKRFWQVKDIIEIKCPYCSSMIEFWKDDPMRYCTGCGELINNPSINLNCAKWCKTAEECLGDIPEEAIAASPIIERLKALLHKKLSSTPRRMQNALDVLLQAGAMMIKVPGNPSLIKPASLFIGALLSPRNEELDNIESPIGDSADWVLLLEQSGMEDDTTKEKIAGSVQSILDGEFIDTKDYAIIWDATQLQRLEILNLKDPTTDIALKLLNAIKTDCGKQMAKRFRDQD